MAIATFRATCHKAVLVDDNGHRVTVPRESADAGVYARSRSGLEVCDLVFEGAEGVAALRAHMKAHHGPRPVIKEPAPLKPYVWKAPRATKGGLAKVAERIAAGDYVVETAHAGGTYRERHAAGEVVSLGEDAAA